MSFSPVVPMGGLAGWAFLKRTGPAQQEAFARSPANLRETERFAEGIAKIRTAEDLVADRQLLKVALGAFGLGSDLDNRYFVRRILEEGTTERSALANKLTDKRYAEMARAFGFDRPSGPATAEPGFAQRIVAAYQARGFEEAVGEQDASMRLALNIERELPKIAGRDASDSTRWFTIMGTPPLRQVFETAFGLPKSFGTLDVDRQLEVFQDKASAVFGEKGVAQFADPEKREELTRLFLARSQLAQGFGTDYSPAGTALALLTGAAG